MVLCLWNVTHFVVLAVFFQRGNPVLKFVRNVPWEFGDIVADYELGQTACALFLRYYMGLLTLTLGLNMYINNNYYVHEYFFKYAYLTSGVSFL